MAGRKAKITEDREDVLTYFPVLRDEYYRLFDFAKSIKTPKRDLAMTLLTDFLDRHADDPPAAEGTNLGPEKNMTLRLPLDVHARVTDYAASQGITKRVLFARALEEYWEGN